MDIFYGIQLDNGAKYRASAPDTIALKVGDFCIIRKDFFLDYGQIVKQYFSAADTDCPCKCPKVAVPPGERVEAAPEENTQPTRECPADVRKQDVPVIQRKATMGELGKANENQARAKSSLRLTQQHIEHLNLPMKLINAHYSFDCKLLTIQFSADGRVDFRELVKILSQEFNTRIELRQIGVRDETAILGGLSPCGRPLCCALFLTEFASINVKMAKEQDLSLTPSTISGICGRLKCCLKYEHEGYLELEKTMPRRGDCCECKEGRGRIVDRNLLTQNVVVQLDESSHQVTCPASEVTVVYPEKFKLNRTASSAPSSNAPQGGKNRNTGRGRVFQTPPAPKQTPPGSSPKGK